MGKKETKGELVLYQPDGTLKLDVYLKDETVWLTQAQIGQLFEKGRTTITEHIQHIFKEGELQEGVVCRNFRHTTQHGAIEGKTQTTTTIYYNLDVIISVGYRVKSKKGTQFRIWATQVLKNYLLKGYAIRQQIENIKKISNNHENRLVEVEKKLIFLLNHLCHLLKVSFMTVRFLMLTLLFATW